jgi:uncharacterized membrane protein YccC
MAGTLLPRFGGSYTVTIVANPSRGGTLSKGVWRIFGTFTGAVATVVIMACFPQQPILFVLALGFWLELCTFASSMFRHFQAYAAVLSGYTVAIVVAGAVETPSWSRRPAMIAQPGWQSAASVVRIRGYSGAPIA